MGRFVGQCWTSSLTRNFCLQLGAHCLFRNHGYELMNAGFAYRLPKGIEIYGRLNNFLNQRYEEAFGFPSLKLNFMAGFKVDLPPRGRHGE